MECAVRTLILHRIVLVSGTISAKVLQLLGVQAEVSSHPRIIRILTNRTVGITRHKAAFDNRITRLVGQSAKDVDIRFHPYARRDTPVGHRKLQLIGPYVAHLHQSLRKVPFLVGDQLDIVNGTEELKILLHLFDGLIVFKVFIKQGLFPIFGIRNPVTLFIEAVPIVLHNGFNARTFELLAFITCKKRQVLGIGIDGHRHLFAYFRILG